MRECKKRSLAYNLDLARIKRYCAAFLIKQTHRKFLLMQESPIHALEYLQIGVVRLKKTLITNEWNQQTLVIVRESRCDYNFKSHKIQG